jgi:trigger factor
MSTVSRTNIGLLNDKVSVTVSPEDFLPAFDKALKQYAKTANIPGFRKGMVPSGMIRKMYGSSVYTDEVLRTVERTLMEYLQNEKLDIFAQPLPSPDNDVRHLDFNKPSDHTFSFEVGLKPEFQVADLSKANVTRHKVEVTEEMVNEEVDRLQRKLGKLSEPGSVTTEDNVLNVTFEACDAEGNVAEGTPSKENSLLVKYFNEDFRKNLEGRKKDDSLVLSLGTAFGDKEREWLLSDLGLDKNDPASLEKNFRMTITKVGLVEKRELNEEFFLEAYPNKDLKTEAELRDQIRNEIAQYWENQSSNHLQHQLYHYLNEQTSMEFPENFLRRWMMEGQEKPKSADEVEAEFPTFRNQLRWTLVSDKIVRDQQIQVGREEIMDQMKQQVMGYFGSMSMDANLDWLDSYVERMMQDENQVDSAYRRVITEKIFKWAETQVHPTERSISVEAFADILKEHQHEH